MMFSALALTSCDDVYKSAESFVKEKLEEWGVVEARTTITKEEWNALVNTKNLTLILSSDGNLMKYEISKFAIYINYSGQRVYYAKVDNKVLMIMQDEAGTWVGGEFSNEWPTIELSTLLGDEEIFDSVIYDEARKVYTIEKEGSHGEFKFENGRLIEAVITAPNATDKVTITKVGTTVVELPDYIPYEEYIANGGYGTSTAPN
jgi:hypothetical protein